MIAMLRFSFNSFKKKICKDDREGGREKKGINSSTNERKLSENE